MKILVCLKQVPHQDARLDVNADGTWITEDNIKFEINNYDTYALEEALRTKDAGEAEVVVVSIGPDRVTQAYPGPVDVRDFPVQTQFDLNGAADIGGAVQVAVERITDADDVFALLFAGKHAVERDDAVNLDRGDTESLSEVTDGLQGDVPRRCLYCHQARQQGGAVGPALVDDVIDL